MLDYRKMMLLYERGSTKNNLAEIFKCKWETVDRAITRIKGKWGNLESIPSSLSNEAIKAEILKPTREANENFLQPDFSELSRKDLKSMNAELWVSYCNKAREQGKKAYQPTKFNEILGEYKKKLDISYTQIHEPGLECQVDWTGDHGHYMDDDTGEWIDVHVIVITLPYSGYFYAEGFLDEKMDSFLAGHAHAFEFFGGVTPLTVPDNCATATDRKTGILNTQYTAFLDYYGSLPKPTRIKTPTDKGSVEAHVKVVEKGILPQLDRLPILSLEEYNRFLIDKVREKNAKERPKKPGSRLSVFLEEEKPRLQPLPEKPFHRIIEKKATVERDFHLLYCSTFYSVPVDYIGKVLTVRDDGSTIKIYSDKDILITEHRKATKNWQRSTKEEHIPKGHDNNAAYSLEYFLSWAAKYGPNTLKLCQAIVNDFMFPVQAFRTLRAILVRANRCKNATAVEVASEECWQNTIHSSKGFSTILTAVIAERQNTDKQEELNLNSLYCTRYKEDENEN